VSAAETDTNVETVKIGKTFTLKVSNPDNLPVKWTVSDTKIVKATRTKDNNSAVKVTPISEGEFFVSAVVGEKKYKSFYNAVTFRSAKDIVDDMGIGINLSNTFDATDYDSWLINPSLLQMETAWLPPPVEASITTKKLIDTIADAGFDSIRIPVTWSKALEDDNLTIRKDWMVRVKEVVDWSLDAGLYVIINTHHDNGSYDGWETLSGYFSLDDDQFALTEKRYTAIWTQISEEFKDYDDCLIFEGTNEPREVGIPEEWSGGTAEGARNLNKFNDIFVKTVRKSGGNNSKRALMVSVYAANVNGLSTFKMPDDDNLIFSFHCYDPYLFTITADAQKTWSASNDDDTYQIKEVFSTVNEKIVSNGIPAICGEYGALVIDKSLNDRVSYTDFLLETAQNNNVPCFLWIGGSDFLNRESCEWQYPEILEVIQKYTD
jgi:endoglucanase